jgi:hypothetical protein
MYELNIRLDKTEEKTSEEEKSEYNKNWSMRRLVEKYRSLCQTNGSQETKLCIDY